MTDYRPETFYQFVRTKKPPFFLRWIWAGLVVYLVIIFFSSYKRGLGDFFETASFFIIGAGVQAFFMFSFTYKMYAYGRTAFLELCQQKQPQILNNCGVFIRGFSMQTAVSSIANKLVKPIYSFDKADLMLGSASIVLLGNLKQFGTTTYASPVEIVVTEKKTSIATAKLLSWHEERGRIIFELKDSFYTKPFKIEFKDHFDEIKEWLLQVNSNIASANKL